MVVPDPGDMRFARLDRMADTLDARFRIPGLGWRFGWDSVLGLLPGMGDLVTIGPAIYVIYEGHRLGARKSTLARMGLNSGLDLLVGSVPIFGDIFDASFKSNKRNVALLKEDLTEQARDAARRSAHEMPHASGW
ncbi:DUF4112 domain-containing protein [Dinoroseobacter sp. S76]|uniref:DUF4112 domain-containing protein n=1 Tax=Dinoroseobacter sp. S76 TaxID=3415124 RepID=UPI003C7CBA0C